MKKQRETPDSKLRRAYEEWYAHNTGLDTYYPVKEMIDMGILSMPVYQPKTHISIKTKYTSTMSDNLFENILTKVGLIK